MPPVALVPTIDSTSLTCDHFFLPGLPARIGPKISIIENTTIQLIEDKIIDLQSKLSNQTNWEKIPYIAPNIEALIQFISNTPKPPPIIIHSTSHTPMFIIIGIGSFGLILIASLLFHHMRSKRPGKKLISITLPAAHALEELTLDKINTEMH